MDILYYTFLGLHISGGATGLITGSVNLFRKKGDKRHKLFGRIFSYGMITAALSALALSIIHPNYFLFIVGAFSLYLVGTGNRYLVLRSLGQDQKPMIIDWMLTIVMMVLGIVFIVSGAARVNDGNYFGIVYIVFGAIGLNSARRDLTNYRGQAQQKNYWLAAHIQRMTGGYIAALTAFIVVNSKFIPSSIPPVVLWLSPTVLLVPLIVRWIAKYAPKKIPQKI